ncbi:MAG TPA: glycoside hydrolase family 16 protein [Bacteroidales bacterium]|nr:glycoside hydrolase family 16 protein [Bacteroidales bacterium]
MQKTIISIFLYAVFFSVFPLTSFSQLPKNDPTWQLVFEDEFDSIGLNTTHFNQNDWKCGLYAYWDNDLGYCVINQTNHTTDNSNLLFDTTGTGKITIRTKKHNPPVSVFSRNECDNTDGMHNFNYTTAAWLASNDKFKYGYFEIRCKLPVLTGSNNSLGLGPNFWLYENPDSIDGICYSEIDIFEFLNDTNIFPPEYQIYTSNSIFRQCSEAQAHNSYIKNGYVSFNDFHTFALMWTPSSLKYYKDDQLVYTSINHPDSMIPMRIILDVNIPTQGIYPDSYSLFPYDYEIDYVKVWQPRENCDSNIVCDFDASNYNYSKVNSISIGGSNCNAAIGQTDNVSLKAVDYIEFKEGFSVELGGVMSAVIENCFDPVHTKMAPPKRQPTTNEIPPELIRKFFH